MKPLTVYSPDQIGSSMPPDLSFAAYRFLAEGDSWFTISTLNPARNSNLLFEMKFDQFACAVNCAMPGDTLSHMVEMNSDPMFVQLLCGSRASIWDGLLLSCGGNDLIDALAAGGDTVPPEQRVLLAAADWGPPSDGAARYLSPEGWTTFSNYLRANVSHLLALRDAGPSAGCPAFIHGYACPTPRDAGAGFGLGPWLLPSMQSHGIPQGDWVALSALLMRRLGSLLAELAADDIQYPNLHYFDSSHIAIEAATVGAAGPSGDWVNEIHLTRSGCAKIAVPWAAEIERVLRGA